MANTVHPVGRLAGRFYSDRRLIGLLLLLAIAAGVSSLAVLPRMEDPLLTQRAANITTVFPGANAERVEALVTEKIEDELIDIPEIKRMRSQSRAGSSFISIELRDDVYDTDPIWSSIRGKLEDSISNLPDGAMRPEFNELEIAAYAWIGAIVWDRDAPPASGVLRRLARELKDDFFSIDGTKKVDLFGDPLEEIIVEIDPTAAMAAKLSAASIAEQLSRRDVKAAVGLLHGETSETVVEIANQFESLEDIAQAPIVSKRSGETLILDDLAEIRRSSPDPPASAAIIDGRPGIAVSVMLRPSYRIDQWSVAAHRVIQQFEQRLPTGVKLDIIMEQDGYVAQRMSILLRNLVLGVSAVALVTLLFMGWRSSLLVTATLPIASLMVIAGMRFLDIPIHQMSITGLIIALGLLIDNAIIAADEISLSLRRGLSPLEAVQDMVSRLFAPLLASTTTTALAFAPIALMEGPAGEFVGSIAVTVMLAIFSSLFLAMTVLPASAALLQRSLLSTSSPAVPSHTLGEERHSTGLRQTLQHGLTIPAITRLYRRTLHTMFSRPWLGVGFGAVLPILGFVAATKLDEQFFPPADRDQFYLEVELEPQATLAQTAEVTRQIDRVLVAHPRVEHTSWFLGESAPPFYYNIIARRKNNPNYGQAIVTLESNENSLLMIRELQLVLDAQFPSARILVRQLEQGPPFDAPVEIRIFGSDLERLKDTGERLRTIATRIPDVLHTRTALSDTRPVASVEIKASETSWTGLSEAQIADQLFARLEGIRAGTIIEEVEEIPVRVRIAENSRAQVQDVGDSSILISRMDNSPNTGQTGRATTLGGSALSETVPVSSIADITMKPQRAVITRYNGRRMNEVQCFITAGTLPSTVLNKLQKRIQSSQIDQLPPGFSLEVGGEASERNAAVSRLMANVSVLAVGMVGSLVLALASFRLAALIGVVASLSIGLGMGALWLFGYPFGFMAIVGTMGLIGIAINDSIVVVAALKANPHIQSGSLDAIVETVVEVTRHVLATTFTTIVGFLPLVVSGGGFWPPLAVAIGTGVAGATLISLTLVPSTFRLMHREPNVSVS